MSWKMRMSGSVKSWRTGLKAVGTQSIKTQRVTSNTIGMFQGRRKTSIAEDNEQGQVCCELRVSRARNTSCRTEKPWQESGKMVGLYWKVFKSMNQGNNVI